MGDRLYKIGPYTVLKNPENLEGIMRSKVIGEE
jgi:hypothetical protein